MLSERMDLDRISLDAAYRIARERGMTERSRLAREIGRAAIRSVRDLLSEPGTREERCEAC